MIINHAYKFIFFNIQKTGSTSVQISLAENCNGGDIWLNRYKSDFLDEYDNEPFYKTLMKETFDPLAYSIATDRVNYTTGKHTTPEVAKKITLGRDFCNKWGEWVFEDYLKVGVIRNPWDAEVSSFWWRNRNKSTLENKTQEEINGIYQSQKKIFHIEEPISCYEYYFDYSGNPILDHVLRFENLEKDFQGFCDLVKMPRVELKKYGEWVKTRKDKRHYSTYYKGDKGLLKRHRIQHLYKRFLEFYPYEFEEVE